MRRNHTREVRRGKVSLKRDGLGAGLERHVILVERGATVREAHDGNAAIARVHHNGDAAPALRAHAGGVLREHANRHEIGDVARDGCRRETAHLGNLDPREGTVVDERTHDASAVGIRDELRATRHAPTSKENQAPHQTPEPCTRTIRALSRSCVLL